MADLHVLAIVIDSAITGDIASAVDTLARIKDNPAFTKNTPSDKVVQKYLDQNQMFERELTPDQERLLVHIDKISRKPTEVRAFFQRYATMVEEAPVPGQVDLFGNETSMSKQEFIERLTAES